MLTNSRGRLQPVSSVDLYKAVLVSTRDFKGGCSVLQDSPDVFFREIIEP